MIDMRSIDVFNLKREISNTRNELEKFDVDAHIDRTLSYHENRQNIRSMFGMGYGSDTRRAMSERAMRINKRRERDGEFYQVGSSNYAFDERRSAQSPGFRRTGWGTSYVERRKNRSDRPGRRI